MDQDPQELDEYVLPSAQALLAGTLALMTAYAQCRCAERRGLLADKVAANLEGLVRLGGLPDPFRAALGKLQVQWQGLASGAAQPPWHAMPRSVQ